MKKKMLKKLLVTLLTLSMVCCLAACGNGGSDTGTSDNSSSGETSHKIGVIIYGNTDSMGAAVYSYLNHAAELLDVDITWTLGSMDDASQLSDAENLIAAGCEGIIYLPMSDTINTQIGKICEQNEVYFAACFRDIGDDEIIATMNENAYYVGRTYEDDYSAAIKMTEIMAADGRTVCGQVTGDPSSAMSRARNEGFIEGASENGIDIVAEYQAPLDGNTQTYIDGTTNFVNLYPDMNGILAVMSSIGAGETYISTLSGLTTSDKIKIATFDTFDGMEQAFEDGWLIAAAGGMAPDALFTFLALYNAVDGTPLSTDGPVVLQQNELIITSAEECQIYAQYVDNPDYQIYTDDQIKSLVGRFNSDVTIADYNELMSEYSIEWLEENAH